MTSLALFNDIYNNLKYSDKNIEGLVVVSFVIDTNGSIVEAKIVKSLSKTTDTQALRLINEMPFNWQPGMQRSRPVSVKYNIPIRFKKRSK